MTYLKSIFQKRREILGDNEDLNNIEDAMTSAGVASDEDFKDFYYIGTYVPAIINNILGRKISQDEMAMIAHEVYSNRDEWPINTIINFHKAVKNAIDKLEIPIKKMAYPQVGGYFNIHPVHDVNYWVECMKKIYALKAQGKELKEAFDIVTKDWDNMNKNDFKHWLDFYQSGQHLSYKMAQYSESGPYIPYGNLKATIPGIPSPLSYKEHQDREKELLDQKAAEEAQQNEVKEKEKLTEKEIIAEKTKQLIGRLNSAEKIFTTNGFHKLFGESYQVWLEALMKLKRDLQVALAKNASNTAIDDLIYRTSNIFNSKGMVKSAGLIVKIAQEPPPVGEKLPPGELPPMGEEPIIPEDPETGMTDSEKSDPEGAMREFLENIGVEIEDENDVHDLSVLADEDFDGAIISIDEPMTAFAQLAEPVTPVPPAAAPIPAKKPVELEEDKQGVVPDEKIEETGIESKIEQTDDLLENALKNVTINDIIARLEQVAILHKNRPMSRELSIVDLMMQALGIASYFPNLAEAAKSALDSNQYVLTRIEDILAKLRGATGAVGVGTDNIDSLKSKLQTQEENKNKQRENKEKAEMVPGGPQPPQAPTEQPVAVEPVQKELEKPTKIAPPQEGIRV